MATTYRCVCAAAPALRPVALAPGLSADSCGDCHGHWLAMDDYRRWVANRSEQPSTDDTDLPPLRPAPADDGKARACPSCQRWMERLRVGRSPDFRLDRCGACIDELARVRAWLATQPQRETLLALLRSGW